MYQAGLKQFARGLWLSIFLFCCGLLNLHAQTTPPPVIISEATSTRAIALEAQTFMREPFTPVSAIAWSADQRTRVMLFALNLTLQPGDDLAHLSADAEDAEHQYHSLRVEYVGPVPGQEWLSAIVLRLSDDLNDNGDVLVAVAHNGVNSNRVRIGIGHVGGGPADDDGAAPTPAPPYLLSGQIVSAGKGLEGVSVSLTGPQTGSAVTDQNGFYSFTITTVGDYTITPTLLYFSFDAPHYTLSHLSNNQLHVNFTASRNTYALNGQVRDDQAQGLDGISMSLTQGTGVVATTTTSGGGHYTFANVPAGFSYTVLPATNSVFAFQPQSIDVTTSDQVLNFSGARRHYTISGRVLDNSGRGVSGLSLTLSGAETQTVNTNADGSYAFAPIPAGVDYMITLAQTTIYNSAAQSVTALTADQVVDFRPTFRPYVIGGRVTDGRGNGLNNILVTLSGTQTATSRTDTQGNYSFNVSATGDYTLTPSIEQDVYDFSPLAQSFHNVIGDQTGNFTAAMKPLSDPTYVLEFDGSPETVDYGVFWQPNVNLGHFFWEFWAMPGPQAGATYLLSDGYGGAHALLFGFANYNTSEVGRYQMLGNIFDGVLDASHITYFISDQGPAVGEWGHFAVGWDGQSIITYFDGVPVGKAAYARPRQTAGPVGGGGHPFIGGSNHNNFDGRIAQVRGYEDRNPREDTSVEAAFAPETIFQVDGNLLSYYFRPAQTIADLSHGYNSQGHIGVPRGTTGIGILYGCDSCPPPKFVIDPQAPNFVTGTPPHPVLVDNPAPVPNGATVFDSFARANSTYIFNGQGGLGTTEGGTAGPQVWQTNQPSAQPQPFGILNGRAVLLANDVALAWVATGTDTGSRDIRVDRHAGLYGSGLDTGLSFRVLDSNNFCFAYTAESSATPGAQTLTVGYYLAGQRTELTSGLPLPNRWTTLRVVTTNAGDINVYADGTLLYAGNSNVLTTATGAGLYNNGRNLGLVNRWDNFTVFVADDN
jgi:Concanavalin A-like lectin/glucanases superfamily/Carboxypeptidase regulatory-like domain